MSKQSYIDHGGRRSGKSKAMRKAIEDVFALNPLSKVAIISTSGIEIIEGTTYEEVKPAELPSGSTDKTDNHETV